MKNFLEKKKLLATMHEETFETWINTHVIARNILVVLMFLLFAFVSNWSLLIGENIMKWDIWQAEYPNQVLMSDALTSGTIPLWNPLMQYGSPHYSIVGTPIWYPPTLLLALIGYTPLVLSVSYVMHIIIGGLGMYFLALENVTDSKVTITGFFSSFLVGLLYCGSGLFLSNAQHIMIIISAAWIPYVFLFARKYVSERNIVFAMIFGICASMIFLGGYPEMFYDTFLYLIPYFLYFVYKEDKTIIRSIFNAGKKFILCCTFTIMAAAIGILPFLNNMKLITRGNGLGQYIWDLPAKVLLSLLFPSITRYVSNVEPSMVNFYTGIIVIVVIPLIWKSRKEIDKLYIGLAIVAFMFCFSNEMFLHSFLYRFLPMYSTFRFPTLNRIFFTMFLLLVVVKTIQEILEGQITIEVVNIIKIILTFSTVCVLGGVVLSIFMTEESLISLEKCDAFATAALISGFILLLYGGWFYRLKNEKRSKIETCITLGGIICTELLLFSYCETPLTITLFEPKAYSYSQMVRDRIDNEFTYNQNRNRSVNFANNLRSTSNLNSQKIVFEKTFDEDGYVSFLIQAIENFKSTYYRSIIETNPIVYFTNDIVSDSEVNYNEWINSPNINPEQIYVEKNIDSTEGCVQRFEPDIIYSEELVLNHENGIASIVGNLSATSSATGNVRLYFEDIKDEVIEVTIIFLDENNNRSMFYGEFNVKKENGEKYIDIYFPSVDINYQSLEIEIGDSKITKAQLVVKERLSKDNFVDVSQFSFNTISMHVEAKTKGYITLLQTWHEGWNAYVDGIPVEIDLINKAFMGVYLEEGDHEITFKFQPMDFYLGVIISSIYYVIFFVIFVLFIKEKYQINKRN